MILIENKTGSSVNHRTYDCYPDRDYLNYELDTAVVWITAGKVEDYNKW